jgi:hypothetical protein
MTSDGHSSVAYREVYRVGGDRAAFVDRGLLCFGILQNWTRGRTLSFSMREDGRAAISLEEWRKMEELLSALVATVKSVKFRSSGGRRLQVK